MLHDDTNPLTQTSSVIQRALYFDVGLLSAMVLHYRLSGVSRQTDNTVTTLIVLQCKAIALMITVPLCMYSPTARSCNVSCTFIAVSFLNCQIITTPTPSCSLCAFENFLNLTLEMQYLPANMRLF